MQQQWFDTGTDQVPRNVLEKRKGMLQVENIVALSRKDPDTFVNFTMSYNAPTSGPNKWYSPTESFILPNGQVTGMTCKMHRDWQDAISNYDKTYIEAPREHSKTTRVTMGRALWELGNNPDIRIKIVCQNDEKAAEIVTAISQHILTNERVRAVFPTLQPDVFGQWARHKIYVKRSIISRDASIESSGILAGAVGGRADLLLFDDPVDNKNAIQFPALRETVKQVYYGVWLNLLPAYGGRLVYICTPWHMLDLSMDIKNNHPEYFMCSNPINDAYEPVWPTKWDIQALENRRRDIGNREFDRGFKLKPLSEEEALFHERDFEKLFDYSLNLGELPGDGKGWKFYTGVDLGIGSKSSTKTSIFTFGMRKGFPNIPVEIKVGRFGETEKVRQIHSTYERWEPELIIVENNSYQETFLSWMKEMHFSMPVRGVHTGNQKMDLLVGLPSLAVEIENGMWSIPRGGHRDLTKEEMWTGRKRKDTCTCPVCQWLGQCYSFPIGLSDILMSWWIAREGYRNLASKMGPRIRLLTAHIGRKTSNKGWSADKDDDDDD